MYNVFVKKTIENENVKINFVEFLKGFQTELYFNINKKGYMHRKMIYSNVKEKGESLKRNSQRLFKVDNDEYKYIIVVEEYSLEEPIYTVFIEYSKKMELVSIKTNHIITPKFLDFVNKAIQKENEKNIRLEEYKFLPQGVKNCIPLDDIEFLKEAISKNTWYSRQMYRLDCLPFILETPLVKEWLSKLGIYSVSKKQKDLDCLVVYVAKQLTAGLPKIEKQIFLGRFAKLERQYIKA